MRIDKLFELQGDFFARYPDGFDDEAIVKIRKKHNLDKLAAQAKEAFAETKFGLPESIIQSMILMISRSSMVFMFDRLKFRDRVGALSPVERELVYKPKPSFEFYRDYSAFLTNLRDEADPRLSPSNAAFTGFLMMTIN